MLIRIWLDSKWFKFGGWGSLTELFLGGKGAKFPYLHRDYYNLSAWITQLYGEKRFHSISPWAEELLYVGSGQAWQSPVNIFEPDYKKHPKFRDATPIHFTVSAGETLYIPFGVWHSAYSETPTISVAFDQLSGINRKDFMKDVWALNKKKPLSAISKYGYATLASRSCQVVDMLGIKR